MILPRSPIFGQPNYDFNEETTTFKSFDDYSDENDDESKVEEAVSGDLTQMTFWYMTVLIVMLVSWLLIYFCLRMVAIRQKTRSSQQRRVYVGSRTRQLSVQEPSIYVSPANLPPPPKYEAMAPPSYEEVVGVHYPGYQAQPITQPITHALSQSTSTASQDSTLPNVTVVSETAAPAVITVTTEQRRTSVSVRS